MEVEPRLLKPTDWLAIATNEIGIKEWDGEKNNNPEIMKYWEVVDDVAHADEVPWCAAFVNWVLTEYKKRYGIDLHPTKQPNARSFLKWGKSVKDNPVPGSIVIYWRGTPGGWQGHVGFYLKKGLFTISTLGGNQGDKVCVSDYSKIRLLDIRFPDKVTYVNT